MTEINKVRTDIPFAEAIRKLQDNDNKLLGLSEVDTVDAIDLQDLFSGTGHSSRFTRDFPLGHSLATYNLFSGVSNEAGYTIWKYPVTNFKDSIYNALYLDDVKLDYRGSAISEAATSFNSVFLLSGTTWVNDTTEAGTDNGTAFGLMSHSSNSLYIGDTNTFNGIDFNLSTLGYNYDLKAYYFSGTWVELSPITHSLNDDTSDLTSNGRISFDIPTDWISGTFNGVSNKWIKLTTDSNPITTAQAYYIRPDDSVKNLLSLSSDDILDKNWSWCYFNNYVYLTLKNRGGIGYEGNEWVRIESNDTNRKNYFVYNHELKTTYQNNTWGQWFGEVPSQTGNANKFLSTNGVHTFWSGTNPVIKTFIPTLSGTTSGVTSLAGSDNTLTYMKNGSLLTITGYIQVNTVSGLDGQLVLANLPYTNYLNRSGNTVANVIGGGLNPGTTYLWGEFHNGENKMFIYAHVSGTTVSATPFIKASSTLTIFGSHFTSD
ncbi:MAG: hypothetical protein PHU43_11525 [Candidatus Bipolaricaulis sp.]|nr:hypothetical protein [Candidatus Bipolaricaulis sp.]